MAAPWIAQSAPLGSRRRAGRPASTWARASRGSTLLPLLLAVLASPSQSQEQEPRWFAAGDEVEVAELLDACSGLLKLPLQYDRAQVQGRVTIRSGPGQSPDAFWATTNRLLAERKLACIQGSGEEALGIVPIGEAAKLARMEPGKIEDARAGFVKTIVELHRADPAKVTASLVHALSTEGSLVQAIPESRSILIAGLTPQVLQALEIVKTIETSDDDVVVEEFSPAFVSPTAMAGLLERVGQTVNKVRGTPLKGTVLADPYTGSLLIVAPVGEVVYWRDTLARFDRPEVSVTREYQPRRFGLKETARLVEEVVGGEPGTWKLVQDELTGTIVLTATPAEHEAVRQLLNRLEAAPPDANRTVRSFAVRHRDVDEMLTLLDEMLGQGVPAAAPAPAATPAPAVGPAPSEATPSEAAAVEQKPDPLATGGPVSVRADEVTLAKDSGTNRIVAVGPPRLLEEIGQLIESLDLRHPQVLVEALIVTLTEGQSRDLAVELQKLGTADGTLFRLASLFDAGSPDPSSSSLPVADGTGLETVVLDPGSFSGVLRALETVNHGRTLTVPKVLVNNNETATLDSVLQTPYASTNASTTVATTSFGGTLDAGTQVSVTPQITEGDELLLDYTVALSTFVGEAADPALPPPRQENRLQSSATVPDGFAVVVGGLEVERESEGESRVPLLGSLPLLGHLFKSQTESASRSRFFVFLRCSVLRQAQFADLKYLSVEDLRLARVPDDCPEVEPRVIR
jgi:type II secretory pathway component GspD/PulD (secretin)